MLVTERADGLHKAVGKSFYIAATDPRFNKCVPPKMRNLLLKVVQEDVGLIHFQAKCRCGAECVCKRRELPLLAHGR